MDPTPTTRQRELGRRLREFRGSKGFTVEDVARELMCSATKISRTETGARRPSLRDVRDLCELYQVGPEASAALMDLAREARQPGWWAQYDDLTVWFSFIGLEQEATAITCFSLYYLPALVQTPEYAGTLISSIHPAIDASVLDQRVEARLRRQQLLCRPQAPRYRAILDEAVLRRQVGGPKVMKDQLSKLLQLMDENRVVIQVIPMSVGAYPAADSNFDLLEFGDSSLPGLVYVESFSHELFLDHARDLEVYREAIESLRDLALSPQDSIRMIRQLRDELSVDV
jgi:transcriptional regulator with XRE-family HTH domain